MRIGINLGLTANWEAVLAAVRKADEYGFDAVSFPDHYQAEGPDNGQVCGWSLYGAVAVQTTRIKLLPMVLCRFNYLPGMLAKESTIVSLLSQGRFELGIGAGDYFEEMEAWGVPVPEANERIEALKETVLVLQRIWQGEPVTFEGKYLHIHNGLSVPRPIHTPRVVVGVGSSRRLLRSAVEYADEINVFGTVDLIREAQREIALSGRTITLSAFVWKWRENVEDLLQMWEQLGVERAFVTLWDPFDQLERAIHWMR